jgi:hypothetical protein
VSTLAHKIYRKALLLYPAEFRSEFGEEMAETFDDSARDRRSAGAMPLLRFYSREAVGLIRGAISQTSVRRLFARAFRRWSTPLLGGILAGIVFLSGAVLAGGPFIFSPVLNLFALLLLVAGSIWVGRAWSGSQPLLKKLVHSGIALFLILGAVPAVRMMDDGYLNRMAEQDGQVHYAIPGISVMAKTASTVPQRLQGLVYSRTRPRPGADDLVAVWHRGPSSPPYELIVVLLAIVLTLTTHEVGRARDSTVRS